MVEFDLHSSFILLTREVDGVGSFISLISFSLSQIEQIHTIKTWEHSTSTNTTDYRLQITDYKNPSFITSSIPREILIEDMMGCVRYTLWEYLLRYLTYTLGHFRG